MPRRYFSLLLSLSAVLLTACGESDSSSSENLCQSVSQSLASSTGTGSGTDPLLTDQWHLNDINLPSSVWADSGLAATGKGVTVAVLDTSIDYNHPDLFNNLNTQKSCHFTNSTSTSKHATSVAGIIGSEYDNGKGGSGIAPESEIIGMNILNASMTNSEWAAAFGYSQSNVASADIFNQSFGIPKVNSLDNYDETFHAYYQNGITLLRNGKGALYFKAAGNDYEDYGSVCTDAAVNANNNNLPCQNANMDRDNNIPFNIVVSALNTSGVSSSYSSTGSSVIFSAPGGEYGVGSSTPVTTKYSDSTSSPAITTTTSLENGSYTSTFNGTSSATPMASGVAALVLQKNSNLGWRDVRHILLTTADKIDSARDTDITLSLSDGILTTEPAWQNNGAGFPYHNWYGFGRINAQAAVNAAASYGSNLPVQKTKMLSSGTINSSIPDNSITGTSSIQTVSAADALTVESVQVKVNLSHDFLSDLQIQLTSPSGMKSVLMTPRNAMGVTVAKRDAVLLSQAFYGENSQGNWKLEVFDTKTSQTGTVHNWSMTIYGH